MSAVVSLDYPIDFIIKEGNKTKEKLSVFFREFTPEEKKEQKALVKKFRNIYKKANKLGKKQASLIKKAELYELNGEYEKAIKVIDEKEQIDVEVEDLQDELEAINGEDENSFDEKLAEDRFNILVNGKDKEKLSSVAMSKGFIFIMRALDKEKAALEKKQFGE